MERYLQLHHHEDITKILESPKKAKIHEIHLDLTHLKEHAQDLFDSLMKTTEYNKIANKWKKAIKNVQQEIKDARMGENKTSDVTEGSKKTQSSLSPSVLDLQQAFLNATVPASLPSSVTFSNCPTDLVGSVSPTQTISTAAEEINNDLLTQMKPALKTQQPEIELSVKQNIAVRLSNHPNYDQNYKLFPDKQFLKIVAFQAVIVKKRQPKTRMMTKQFMCQRCKNTEIVYANRYFGYGFVHGKCTRMISFETGGEQQSDICMGKTLPVKYTPKKSQKTLQTQVYEVTTPYLENVKVYGEKTYLVDVEGKLINSFEVGETVNIIGVVKTRSACHKAIMKKFTIAALNIESHQKIQDSTKDLESNTNYRVLSAMYHDLNQAESELTVRNKMVKNLFPQIVGAHAVKLSILLVLCSGSGQSESDGDSKRDVFHLMLAGENSAGKRALLRAAAELTPKSNEVHSFGLSLSSLTARSFKLKKGGDNNIEAGVLLRANDGVCCFHDFNGLKKKFRRVLHEIMETQRIKVASARLKANIKVSASIIAAQRIKRNRHKKNDNQVTTKMFKIEESLLNRFDLIFIMNEPKKDQHYKKTLIDMVLNEAMGNKVEEEIEWPLERITAHIATAKTIGTVEFTEEVEAILRKYFLFCTINPNIPKWRTTNRMYEGLRRITAAHARLMLRRKTKIFDAITTVLLSELSYPLGYLLEMTCELNDPLPGPDDESVEHILWLLKMPEEFYDIYENEQTNFEDIEEHLTKIISYQDQKEQEKEVNEISIIDESCLEQSSDKLNNTSMASTVFLQSTSSAKPKSAKKKNSAKKNPQDSTKKQKAGNKSNSKGNTKQLKRKAESNNNVTNSPKRTKSEPLINDAIISNLSSLAKAFEVPENLQEINETPNNKENDMSREIEDELKALQEFDALFDD